MVALSNRTFLSFPHSLNFSSLKCDPTIEPLLFGKTSPFVLRFPEVDVSVRMGVSMLGKRQRSSLPINRGDSSLWTRR
jgi:hypothetical protein